MAPKRAAARAESSGSSYTLSSSDEDGGPQEEAEEVRLSSASPKKKPPQKQPAELPKPIIAKPSPNPPPAASEDEDESDEEEDDKSGSEDEEASSEESSESEDEKTKNRPPPPTPQLKPKLQQPSPKPTPAPPSDSGSGSSDDSDSGSDSSDESPAPIPAARPSRAVGPSIKPINTKPMDASPKPGKRSPTPPPRPSQERGSGKRKHAAVERSEQDDNHSGQKRQMFQRLWSLDDEIALLNGLVEYRNKKSTTPASARDMEDFRDFIKGTVQAEASNTQLSDKVRRLKKKFETARGKKGVASTFPNSHEQKAYEISMKVWGSQKSILENDDHGDDSDDNEESKRDMRGNQKSKEHSNNLIASRPNNTIKDDGRDIVKDKSQYPYLWETVAKMTDDYLHGVAIKRALEMLDDAKAKQMEEKLKKLGKTEIKQHLRRIDLNKETVKLILDSLSRSERSEQEQ